MHLVFSMCGINDCFAPSGLKYFLQDPQGVALGYHITSLWDLADVDCAVKPNNDGDILMGKNIVQTCPWLLLSLTGLRVWPNYRENSAHKLDITLKPSNHLH